MRHSQHGRGIFAILLAALSVACRPFVWAWQRRPDFLRSMTASRNLSLNVVVVATTVVLLWLTVVTIFKRRVIVEPVAVPQILKDQGYTGEVVAQRIIDEISEIERSSETSWSRTHHSIFDFGRLLNMAENANSNSNDKDENRGTQITAWDPSHSLPNVQLPGAAISLESFVSSIREILGIADTRITGEITEVPAMAPAAPGTVQASAPGSAPAQFIMRARISSKGAVYPSKGKVVDVTGVVHMLPNTASGKIITVEELAVAGRPNDPTAKVDSIFPNVALQIVEQIDPYIAALYYKQNNDIGNALRMVDSCLTGGDPELEPWALNLRASIAREAGRFDEAIEQFNWIDQHYPTFPLSRYNLAVALRQKGEQDPAHAADLFKQAIDAASEGINLDKSPTRRAVGFNNIGTVYDSYKKYEDALHNFEKSEQADHGYAFALYNEGRMYRHLKNLDVAADKFTMAANLDPKDAWTLVYLLHVLDVRSHGGDPMIATLTARASALMGGNAAVYALHGLIDFGEKNWASAFAWYKKAVAADGKNPSYHNQLGRIFYATGQSVSAETEFRTAMQLNPKIGAYPANLGLALMAQQKYPQAIESLRMATTLDPNNKTFQNQLALAENKAKSSPVVAKQAPPDSVVQDKLQDRH